MWDFHNIIVSEEKKLCYIKKYKTRPLNRDEGIGIFEYGQSRN